jgi:hypothetical protein
MKESIGGRQVTVSAPKTWSARQILYQIDVQGGEKWRKILSQT